MKRAPPRHRNNRHRNNRHRNNQRVPREFQIDKLSDEFGQ